jgi:hypothetical protein
VRSDIYAASAILAELATGEASARRCEGGVVTDGAPWPSTMAPALSDAIARGLDVDPNRRQPTIQQWFADVGDALSPGRPAPPPPSAHVAPAPATERSTLRRRWRAAVAAVAAMAVVAAIVVVAIVS